MRISDWSSDVCSSDLPRTDNVDDTAKADIADRIGDLEPEDDGREITLGPAHLLLERRFQDADHLPVDIVDRGGEEEQADDQPAIASGIGPRRRPSRLDCLRHETGRASRRERGWPYVE